MLIVKIIAIILGIVGLVGCLLPVLPGPPVSFAALFMLYFLGNGEMSLRFLLIWAAITVAVTILDYIVPSYFTRLTGGSKIAGRGSLAGMIAGVVFFPPWGMLAGAFLGALLAEAVFNRTEISKSVKPALGSFLGFLCGTFIKLVSSGFMMYYIFKFI
ncbi:MAG: DUF456 domain-containing protein [Bacteroidales bacterium]|nr:DUF456 domain-containing protein [Bacteroidales bacterium]